MVQCEHSLSHQMLDVGIFGLTKKLTEIFCNYFRFVLGMITLGNLMARIVAGKVTPETPLSECIYSKFKKVFILCLFDIFYFLSCDCF